MSLPIPHPTKGLIIKPSVYDQLFDARKLAELLGSVSGIRDGVFEQGGAVGIRRGSALAGCGRARCLRRTAQVAIAAAVAGRFPLPDMRRAASLGHDVGLGNVGIWPE
jgi:hypothetical protein